MACIPGYGTIRYTYDCLLQPFCLQEFSSRLEPSRSSWKENLILEKINCSFVSFSFFFSSPLFFRCRCVDTRTACVRAISLQRACNAWHEFRCEFSNGTIQSVRFFSFSFASFLSLSFFFFRRKFRSRYIQYFYTNLRYKDRERFFSKTDFLFSTFSKEFLATFFLLFLSKYHRQLSVVKSGLHLPRFSRLKFERTLEESRKRETKREREGTISRGNGKRVCE